MLRISTSGKASSADLPVPTPPPAVAAALNTNRPPASFGLSSMLSNARPGFLKGLSLNPSVTGGNTVTTGLDHPLETGSNPIPNSIPVSSSVVDRDGQPDEEATTHQVTASHA
jgi:hypothetical protein